MAEFKITRFRYNWVGDWDGSSIEYKKDDVVYYRGSAWVCIRAHTSSLFDNAQTFISPGNTLPSPAWVKSVDGREFLGEWTNGTQYDIGSLVIAGGNVYLCIISHNSSTEFANDLSNWEVYALGVNWRNTWVPNTIYRVGDVVRYSSFTYQCVLEHTSGDLDQGVVVGNDDSTQDSTSETWNTIVLNYSYVGEYQSNSRYRVNDLVRYGGSILRCVLEHTSSLIVGEIENDYFADYLSGYTFHSDWNDSAFYAVGDVVRYGGVLYSAVVNNSDSQPGNSSINESSNPDWTVIYKGYNFAGAYDPEDNVYYKEGDVVLRGGALWISLTNQQNDNSTLAPFDTSNWKLLISGQNYRGSWNVETYYNFYDVIVFRGTTYYANTPHLSSFENFPGDNSAGYYYWTVLIEGDRYGALNDLGDMLTYNLSREQIHDGSTTFTIGDTSTLGTTPIQIGDNDQLLMVSNDHGDIGYETWGTLQRVVWVRTNGVDDNTDPNRGFNYFKPWRTLRYALEQVDDNYQGYTSIKLGTGEYQEVLPLIVPARTAIIGDELRSTTVRANDPIEALANDAAYTIQTLIHIGSLLDEILLGQLVTPSEGNTVVQNINIVVSNIEFQIVDGLWSNIIDIINNLVNDSGTAPTVTGSNTATVNTGRLNARIILENNREFIKEEAIAWMEENNPLYSFNKDLCRRDLDRYIDAVKYDLLYTGNYKSVLAGRYYANAVRGSSSEDMFYVRDTTGIRNMTLKGLVGTLPALEEGESYTLPTGGAFVSLDPGWGPNDERVWVTNRSCYVQNVTTFGTGAVGQKIDGLLHNGGNKSIVSNDFTQVISDGIGAWVQNGGRAELVSVFTYYAHVGMFAKDGGIIRATNGNSSYGDFGALADGVDPDEVVRYANINTRTEQATIAAAFAGEVNDFILALEFSNAGQNYTEATYTITSSGTGAVAIQEEFRDNAVFETAVLSGGAGFIQVGNQAQGGNTTQIILAAAETILAGQIDASRIILTSGTGTGQYAVVDSYNPSTKVLQVRKESTGELGWDHILPGTPIAGSLDTGTRYRIEPRIEFDAPPFTAQSIELPASDFWAAITYGETDGTFTNVTAANGTGTTIEVTPAPAVFTVAKQGRTYEVTLTDGGAGYAENDTFIILGSSVGGIDVEHDINIRVVAISDDSTNSILAFEIVGPAIGDSGKFIITPANGDNGTYSSDGSDWNTFVLPSSGNWKCLTSGNNKFVAIRNNSDQASYSVNGTTWSASTMPTSRNWNSVCYGKPHNVDNGIFVAVAGNLNSAAISLNGQTWSASTLPTFGDSTVNEYVDITFGANKFLALANSGNVGAIGTWDGTNLTWQGTFIDSGVDSTQKDWTSIAYGNRRFVAISSTGDVAYSFDGDAWYPATMPSQDGSTAHYWRQIRYGQGVFFAVGDTGLRTVGADPTTGESNFAATSYDGVVWTARELIDDQRWSDIAFGNPDVTLNDSTLTNSKPTWVAIPAEQSNTVNTVYTGARALGRIVVGGSSVSSIKLWEPGSGYEGTPNVTIYEPNFNTIPQLRIRMADGVLAQPKFISQGSAYKTSRTFVTVNGDGFADITPNGNFITLDNLTVMPGPGAQFYIAGRTTFFVAVVVGINEETQSDGTILSRFRVSPDITLADYFEHGMEVLIREKYSQVRITGHDFLDVGTGNFEETNYPELYIDYEFTTEPLQEITNLNGGRVFYTSTDQDGNFRAGELFAVEQATGIITISAEFFDLTGLTELRLAGITVGSTAVIREFSKDPLFIQNSNNIVPTQRAIIAYLGSRLNVGGEDLLTPSVIAGLVEVGPDKIDNTADLTIDVPVLVNFAGNGAGVSGSLMAACLFLRPFRG